MSHQGVIISYSASEKSGRVLFCEDEERRALFRRRECSPKLREKLDTRDFQLDAICGHIPGSAIPIKCSSLHETSEDILMAEGLSLRGEVEGSLTHSPSMDELPLPSEPTAVVTLWHPNQLQLPRRQHTRP